MKIWLLKTGEPIAALEKSNSRPFRTGIMAEMFARRGAQVRWWASNYSHQKKCRILEGDRQVEIGAGITVEALNGVAYKRNFSLTRFLNHRQIARRFSELAVQREVPDVIIASYPTSDYARAAVEYARARNIPVLIDLRDMWPDIFQYYAPFGMRMMMRLALRGAYRDSARVMRSATGLIGITQAFLDWGLERAGRRQGKYDMVVPLAYPDFVSETVNDQEARQSLQRLNIPNDNILTICFVGTIGLNLDLRTVLEGCSILRNLNIRFRLVIAGGGDRLDQLRARYGQYGDIIFTGWLDQGTLRTVLRRSDIGVNPMPDRFDFLATINNKAIEYMSAGLPIVMCPNRGTLHELLVSNRSGIGFQTGDARGFANAIMDLERSSSLRKDMGNASRRLFEERFSLEPVYNNFINRIEDIVREWR